MPARSSVTRPPAGCWSAAGPDRRAVPAGAHPAAGTSAAMAAIASRPIGTVRRISDLLRPSSDAVSAGSAPGSAKRLSDPDGKGLESTKDEPVAADGNPVRRGRQIRESVQQFGEGHGRFEPREVVADTDVRPGAETERSDVGTGRIEAVGILVAGGIAVGGADQEDQVAARRDG